MAKFNITTEHTIWCDRCNQWEQQPLNTKRAMTKLYKRLGWVTRKNKTICPDCVTELAVERHWDDVGYRKVDRQ